MHAPTAIAAFLAIASIVHTSLALGINCRGSGLCALASFENKSPERVTQVLRDAVWDSQKGNSTTYSNGDHVICVSQSQSITFSGSDAAGVSESGFSDTSTGTFSLTGSIGTGGICLFPQYMAAGATLTLGEMRPLVDAILVHGCGTCGSVPVHFVDQGSNDPKDGILTFNYVHNPDCIGECISADGTSSSRLKRSAKIRERI
ncbi:hypothetical protein P7C71_g3451, partial [Lecanoromycetidae sp. Uapishka_2]